MDQRPRDLPPKSDWDRLPTTDDSSWSVLPILIVVALIAVGAWLLFANSGTSPTTTTSETTPATTPSPRPVQPPATAPAQPPAAAPAQPPAAAPTTPPSDTAPAPATKP